MVEKFSWAEERYWAESFARAADALLVAAERLEAIDGDYSGASRVKIDLDFIVEVAQDRGAL